MGLGIVIIMSMNRLGDLGSDFFAENIPTCLVRLNLLLVDNYTLLQIYNCFIIQIIGFQCPRFFLFSLFSLFPLFPLFPLSGPVRSAFPSISILVLSTFLFEMSFIVSLY